MDIQTSELGWSFVIECFRQFQGEGVFFWFFLAALAAMAAWKKKDGWEWKFLGYLGVLLLTVYNPLIVVPVVSFLDLDAEYYRFLWLLPVTVMIAWLAVRIIEQASKGMQRAILCLICMVLLAFPGKSILDRGLKAADNLYKVPDEILEISESLHTDSDKENVRILTSFDLTVLLNQYDPSLKLVLPYQEVNLMEDLLGKGTDESSLTPVLEKEMILYHVLYDQQEYPYMDFGNALIYLETEYVVIQKSNEMLEYILTQSCEIIDETNSYYIMKVIPFEWDYDNLVPIYYD